MFWFMPTGVLHHSLFLEGVFVILASPFCIFLMFYLSRIFSTQASRLVRKTWHSILVVIWELPNFVYFLIWHSRSAIKPSFLEIWIHFNQILKLTLNSQTYFLSSRHMNKVVELSRLFGFLHTCFEFWGILLDSQENQVWVFNPHFFQ